MTRARLITAAAFVGSLGWGLILPFQYAYVVNARGWGSTMGVLTGTVFCAGAVVAAPLAGRLADRYAAGRVAVGFQLLAAAASVGLGLADSAVVFLVAIALFGAAVTASAPATQVLVLECVAPTQRRAVFAYQFTALALGMAGGAFVGGHLVDLSTPDGMWTAFSGSGVAFIGAAALLHGASRLSASHRTALPAADELTVRPGGLAAYRHLAQSRPVRLLAIVSMALAAGFYAQFETGLPAFALESLAVAPTTVGTAAAVNCLVIVGLQWLVVRFTGHHSGASLLAVVGSVWVLSWLMLEGALFVAPERAGAIFVLAFAVFAVGETMYAPVLSPLAASVAPAGMLGTTLGALAALRTGIGAAGPLVAGILLALDQPHVFVLGHVAINAVAVVVALRLKRAMSTPSGEVDNEALDPRRSARV